MTENKPDLEQPKPQPRRAWSPSLLIYGLLTALGGLALFVIAD